MEDFVQFGLLLRVDGDTVEIEVDNRVFHLWGFCNVLFCNLVFCLICLICLGSRLLLLGVLLWGSQLLLNFRLRNGLGFCHLSFLCLGEAEAQSDAAFPNEVVLVQMFRHSVHALSCEAGQTGIDAQIEVGG